MRLRRFGCAVAAAFFALMHSTAIAACPNPRLEEFGYNHRPIAGPRPLLTILVDFDDAAPNPARGEVYFRRTLFGASNSVNAMYYTASGGRLNWTQAGIVNLQWRGPPAGLPNDFSQRILRMTADAMRARTGPGMRTMESFDRNGDRVITNDELVILRVSNSPVYRGGAQTTWYTADLGNGFRFDGGTSNVDEEVDINTYAHELWHALGSQDHSYGPGAALNAQATFFAASWSVATSPGMVGLDPYERMRAGWIRPQLIEMSTSGSRGIRLYGDSPADHILLFYSNERCAGEFFLGEFRNAARSPGRIDAGMFGAGVLLWYVKPTADFSPYQFNWPPPILGPYVGPAPNHMIANYIVSANGPGVRGVIASGMGEFNPTWGNGAATGFSLSTNYRPDDDVAFVGWRRAGGRFLARIDAINGAARPDPVALGGADPIAITGQFPVDSRGVRVELVNFSGRTTIAMISYRPDRIELRQPTGLAAGAYQIHLVGDASREIVTRGNQLVTFR